MSWIQQRHRRQQGGWVAAMPHPTAAGYSSVVAKRAQAHACPLVGLVGACCKGCAQGKGCSGKDELEHHHAQVGISFEWRVPSFTETAIPWDEVEKANAAIEHVQAVVPALDGFPPGSPEANRRELWKTFWRDWVTFYGEAKVHQDSIPGTDSGFIAGPRADTYKLLAIRFNDQLESLKAMKVADLAGPIDTRSPAGQAFDAAVDAASGGAGAIAGAGIEAVKWIAIAGGVGLLLYFGGPLVAARLMR